MTFCVSTLVLCCKESYNSTSPLLQPRVDMITQWSNLPSGTCTICRLSLLSNSFMLFEFCITVFHNPLMCGNGVFISSCAGYHLVTARCKDEICVLWSNCSSHISYILDWQSLQYYKSNLLCFSLKLCKQPSQYFSRPHVSHRLTDVWQYQSVKYSLDNSQFRFENHAEWF